MFLFIFIHYNKIHMKKISIVVGMLLFLFSPVMAQETMTNKEKNDASVITDNTLDIKQKFGIDIKETDVNIQRNASIIADKEPLFVVDGIPIKTDNNPNLDPNSIAEISVLKGLKATVLYGEAGRNGVVLITTK